MDDDLDDLLNEVESKFCVKNSNSQNAKSSVGDYKPAKRKDELDDLINEIFDEDDMVSDNRSKKKTNSDSQTSLKSGVNSGLGTSSSLSQGTKCFPVYLGGSSCPQGLTTTVNSRCCDKLRCTDCDFKVSAYDNYQWHSSTDYLFLRNNMPDFPKVKAKLVSKKGSRAYACQCKWRSVKGDKLVNLQTESDLKWVCGKH